MPNLLRAQANLKHYPSSADGFQLRFGLSRDWRPDEKWALSYCDYIEPLGAIGPSADYRPVDMTIGGSTNQWTVSSSYSQMVRNVRASGYDAVNWVAYYDGSVHLTSEDPTNYRAWLWPNEHTDIGPHVAIHLVRYVPPPGQQILPYVAVRWDATARMSVDGSGRYWLDDEAVGYSAGAYLTLLIPWGSDYYTKPVWHIQAADELGTGIYEHGQILEWMPDVDSSKQEPVRETWIIEFATPPAEAFPILGSHILVRRAGDAEYWDYHNPNITIGDLYDLTIQGAQCLVNITPLTYPGNASGVCQAAPNQFFYMPMGRWNAALPGETNGATAEALTWEHDHWTVEAELITKDITADTRAFQPLVTFTKEAGTSAPARPLVWLVREIHPAVQQEVITAMDDTEGDHALRAFEYALNYRWRDAGGWAEFIPDQTARYESWHENDVVTIAVGWQEGANTETGDDWEIADRYEAFIMPDGIERWQSGSNDSGRPQLRVKLGDFVASRMRQQCIIDMCQAGGMTFGDWAAMVANRLNLPTELLSVHASLTSKTIPVYNPIPSKPHLWPQDGCSWEQHLDEVCAACNCRWGWDNGLFFDIGRPLYDPESTTPHLEVDFTETDVHLIGMDARHERDLTSWRNSFKATYGPTDRRKTVYVPAEQLTQLADGMASWVYIDDQESQTSAEVLARYTKEYACRPKLRWRMVYQPHVAPDEFVKVTGLEEIGVTDESVWQILEHRIRLDNASMELTSEFMAERIYEPPEEEPLEELGTSDLGNIVLGGVTA